MTVVCHPQPPRRPTWGVKRPPRRLSPRGGLAAQRLLQLIPPRPVLGRSGRRSCAWGWIERCAQRRELRRDEPIVDPLSASLTLDQAGFVQHAQVVRDGRLGQRHRLDEITVACLTTRLRSDERQQPQACRIGQRFEHPRELLSVVVHQRRLQQGLTAHGAEGVQLGRPHMASLASASTNVDEAGLASILTSIDISGRLGASTSINILWRGGSHDQHRVRQRSPA